MSSADVHESIRSAARKVIMDLPPGVPKVGEWEGVPYDPVPGTPWLRDALVPVSSSPTANGIIEHLSIYTVNLFWPVNPATGTRAIGAAVGMLMDAFKVGTWLEYANVRGMCLRAERRQYMLEPQWVSVPFMARILAYSLD